MLFTVFLGAGFVGLVSSLSLTGTGSFFGEGSSTGVTVSFVSFVLERSSFFSFNEEDLDSFALVASSFLA